MYTPALRYTTLLCIFIQAYGNLPSILVPLYQYPLEKRWPQLEMEISNHPDVTFIVIINPNSGPGTTSLPPNDYAAAIASLKSYSNTRLVGYVHTQYAQKSIADVIAESTIYAKWGEASDTITLDGLFFDATSVASDATTLTYMTTLTSTARTLFPFGYVIANSNAVPLNTIYFNMVDYLVIFQNIKLTLPTNLNNVPPSFRKKCSLFIYGHSPNTTNTTISQYIKNIGVGQIFITSNNGPNPFTSLGNSWSTFVSSFDALMRPASPLLLGYVKDWETQYGGLCKLDTSKITPSHYTHLLVGLADYQPDGTFSAHDPASTSTGGLYDQLVSSIRSKNASTKLVISTLGSNSRGLIEAMSTNDTLLQQFLAGIIQFSTDHKFSGIDLAWPWQKNDSYAALRVTSSLRDMLDSSKSSLQLLIHMSSDAAIYAASRYADIARYVDYVIVDSESYYNNNTVSSWGVQSPSPLSNVKSTLDDYYRIIPRPKMIMSLPSHGLSYVLNDILQNKPGSKGFNSPAGCFGASGIISSAEVDSLVLAGKRAAQIVYDSDKQISYLLNGNRWIGYESPSTVLNKVEFFVSQGIAGVMTFSVGQSDVIPSAVYSSYFQTSAISPSNSTLSTKPIADTHNSSINLAAPISGAVGGALLLLVTILLIVFFRRRTNRRAAERRQKDCIDVETGTDYAMFKPVRTRKVEQELKESLFLHKFIKKDTITQNDLLIGDKIGQGAGGIVFAGKWRGGSVAVKTFIAVDEHRTEECLREVEIMKNLRPHTNLVQYLGVCISQEENLIYIVTQLCEGGSLYTLLHSNEKISQDITTKIIKGVAAGMLHLHSEGVVHRDLAARNILLDRGMEGKVSDFGLSRRTEGGEAQTSSVVGPLKHMAPESLRASIYSEKSDVWAFAVTLFEIYSRSDPYPGLTPLETATHVTSEVHPLRLLPPTSMSVAMSSLFMLCMDTDPKKRPDFVAILDSLNNCGSLFV